MTWSAEVRREAGRVPLTLTGHYWHGGSEMLSFEVQVSSRSSRATGVGPPGEADILRLNPHRRQRILQAAGWDDLFLGSLNLEVDEVWVHRLLLCDPIIRERSEEVVYPEDYAYIPRERVGYLYYRGRIKRNDITCEVLIRRACNPLRTRLEAFSMTKLRDSLSLSDGDWASCEVEG